MSERGRLQDKTLALFFTFKVSLKTWHDVGMIDREVSPYNKLSKYFVHIYFFTYGGREDLEFQSYLADNITIVPMPFLHVSKPSKILFLFMLAYSILLPFIHYRVFKNVDILKTNQMAGSWTAVIAKLLFGKRLVVRTGYMWSINARKRHPGSWKNKIIQAIEKIAYQFADGMIVSSKRDSVYVNQTYNPNGIRFLIPNYIDTNVFRPLDIQKKKNSICFVGRLSKEKNLFSLLEAMINLPYALTIVGSGLQRDDLESYANANGVSVEFLGNLPNSELPRILNQHEIFILPSLYESMPKALLEAMACGLPVIGTDVDGINEVIKHKENGILCGIDPRSIREAILMLMNDEKLKRKIGRKARVMIKEEFSANNLIEREFGLYGRLHT